MLESPRDGRDWVGLTLDPLPTEAASVWAATPRAGAVVCFLGVVRDHAEGRDDVRALTYEAYEEKAGDRLREIADETRRRWPDVERLVFLHRLGEVALSEASVLVVVSTPHRDEAFAAARFAIDTLKDTVPIWKQEHHSGGTEWSDHAAPVRPVREPKLV
ncbi:MAG: molybdenum cofactor biosynthesis protein MoaE [Actinomycetota bacterium]